MLNKLMRQEWCIKIRKLSWCVKPHLAMYWCVLWARTWRQMRIISPHLAFWCV